MKPFWESKTFWVNVIAILILVGDYLFTNQIIPVEVGALVLGILNIILRFVSDKTISFSKPIKD